jgi:mannosyltransferase
MNRFHAPPWTLVALAMLVSAVLTIPQLGLRSLWFDEAYSWWITTITWNELYQVAWNGADHPNMFLYYLLLQLWSAGGDGEVWLRLPSVLFAAAAVWAVARLGSALFEPRVGVTAAFLLALNGLVVQFGQEARAYTMLLFLATLSSYVLVIALRHGTARRWAGFIAVSVLCCYTHVLGAFQVFVQILIVGILIFAASRRVVPALLISAGLILVGAAPLVWFVLTEPTLQGSGFVNLPPVTLGLVWVNTKTLAGGGLLLLAYLPLLVLGLVARFREESPISGGGRFSPASYVVLCFVVPLALIFIMSLVSPLTAPRYLMALVAPLVLAAALGLTAIPGGALRWVALAGIAILLIRGAWAQLAREPADDYRAATQKMLESSRAGDALLFPKAESKMGFDYYARGAADVPPTIYPRRDYFEPPVGTAGAPSPEDIAKLSTGFDRVSILLWHYERLRSGPALVHAFGKDFVISEDIEMPGIKIVRLQKCDHPCRQALQLRTEPQGSLPQARRSD